MIKKFFYLLGMLAAAFVMWLIFSLFTGARSPIWWAVIAALVWLALQIPQGLIHRTNAVVWLAAGVVVLAGLVPPTHLLFTLPANAPPYQTLLNAILFLMPSAAVIIGALLLYSGVTLYDERRQTRAITGGGWVALIFVLLALLLARMLYNIYWLMVWDATIDPLDYLWLAVPFLVSLLCGVGLRMALPKKTAYAALYGLLVPALLVAVTVGADSAGFRERTEKRAARVNQLIEAFSMREGRYPSDLNELIPWDTLSLPGPIIIYGQGWCYDSSSQYYRLAYVDREHWSSPELFAHVYAASGNVPVQPLACETQINALVQSDPGYFQRIEAP